MLDTGSVGVADWPCPFRYALAGNAAMARHVADHLHEHPDAVIWALHFDDVARLGIIDQASRANGRGKFQTIPGPDPQGSLL